MYPPKFEYHRAGSVAEALKLKGELGEAKFLAGGHSLIPVLKLRLTAVDHLIDIGRIAGLSGISASNGSTQIGALTTHATVEKAANLPHILPQAAGWIGDPMVRNRGTVGGNVAHADPASDLPTVFMALGAHFHITGASGERTVAAADFFTGLFETALGEDEMLMAVSFPSQAAGTGSAYAKLFNPASRYAMVGAGAVVTVADGKCTSASVAIGGLTPNARPCPSVVAGLVGQELTDGVLEAAAKAVADDLGDEVTGDIHASGEYRRQMAPVFVARALLEARNRA